ncbi:MAG: hypothetical protein V2I43_27800, partial [Parvularcula sp.]|nr:hypothetical protein [Parvularcula sp.]
MTEAAELCTAFHVTQQDKLTLIVEDGAGERIDRWLSDRAFPSRTQIKTMIKEGAVSVGDAVVIDPTRKMRLGEEVTLIPPEVKEAIPEPEDIPLT